MLFIFMGQSCTGKSTFAKHLKKHMNLEIYRGKDYLKFAENEVVALKLFKNHLKKAAKKGMDECVAYVITDKQMLENISQINHVIMVKFIASIDDVKIRFAERMNNILPAPLERMLEKQYNEWKNIKGDFTINTSIDDEQITRVEAFLDYLNQETNTRSRYMI